MSDAKQGAPKKYVKNSDGLLELNPDYKDWKNEKDMPVAVATPVEEAAASVAAVSLSGTTGFLDASLNDTGRVKEFHVKQKFHMLADNFTINSEHDGKKPYQVKGDKWKWGNQASFQLANGTQIAYIKETVSSTFSMKKTYEIYKGATNGDANAKPWAMVRQQDWNLPGAKKTIYIDVPESGDNTTIVITGDRMAWKFDLALVKEDVSTSGDNANTTTSVTTIETKIGHIDKKWGVMDNYGVQVACQADEVEVLLCAIIIDQIFYSSEDDLTNWTQWFSRIIFSI